MTEFLEIIQLLASISAIVAHITASLIFVWLTWKNRRDKEKSFFYLAMFAFVSGTQQYRPS